MTSFFLAFWALSYVLSGSVCYLAALNQLNRRLPIDRGRGAMSVWIVLGWPLWMIGEVNRGDRTSVANPEQDAIVASAIALPTPKSASIREYDRNTLFHRAKVFLRLGYASEALLDLNLAISLELEDGELWLLRGVALHELGYYKEAYLSYDKALAVDKPSSPPEEGNNRGRKFPNVLRAQDWDSSRPIGLLLQDAGLISREQLEEALKERSKDRSPRLGEIFAERGWIKQATADFFVEQWPRFKSQTPPPQLGEYLRSASLLNRAQITAILNEQVQTNLPFGEVAVRKEWVKPQTINFFVKYQSQARSRIEPFSSEVS